MNLAAAANLLALSTAGWPSRRAASSACVTFFLEEITSDICCRNRSIETIRRLEPSDFRQFEDMPD